MRKKLLRVVDLSAIVAVGFAALPLSTSAQPSDDLKSRVQELEEQLKILRRDLASRNESARPSPIISAGTSGFSFRSADSNFVLRLRGYLQADSRWYIDDHDAGAANDTFLLRRVRPIFEGTVFEKYDFRVMLDFASAVNPSANNNPYVQDAYFTARWLPEFQLVGGKLKEPVSLERLQSGANLLFVERGYTTQIAPNRDAGFLVQGDLFDTLNYSLGAFNGVADGGSADIESTDDEKDVVARLFAHPFRKTGVEPLHELGIGVAGTYGDQEGPLRSFLSAGQQRIFGYSSSAIADGDRWRIAPQGYWYWGPFGVYGEYIVSNQEVVNGAASDKLQHKAWQVAASYVLTGEKNSWRGITPRKPFSLREGGFGALEIAGRIQQLELDEDTFPIFSSASSNAHEAFSWALGLNWHLNRNFKFQVNYEQTDFKGGETDLLRDGERTVFTRAQIAF